MGNVHPKAVAAAPAAMIVVILAWALSYAHVTIPADVQNAFVGIIGLVIGYYVPSPTNPPAA